jgi:hypothetical protein
VSAFVGMGPIFGGEVGDFRRRKFFRSGAFDVPFAPIATNTMRRNGTSRCAISCREQMQQITRADARLFDYLVGAGEQLRRHREIKQSRRLSIDDELKLRRLHRRQVGRSGTLEDAADIEAD